MHLYTKIWVCLVFCLVGFNFKQLCHTNIYVISYLSQPKLPSLHHATYHLLQELSDIPNFLASFCHFTKCSHSIFHSQISFYRSSSKLYSFEALYFLAINRFRISIRHCWNQKLQSTGTWQWNRYNPLLSHEISQGIRLCHGTFPWHKHTAAILEHFPLNAGMWHGPCQRRWGKAQTMLVPSTPWHAGRQLQVSCKGQQLYLSQAELAGGNTSELEGCKSAF